nr:hypothetical protein [Campylobacter volucris]
MSIVLNNILEILKPYLELEANELIFNQPCKIEVDRGDIWETIEDEN